MDNKNDPLSVALRQIVEQHGLDVLSNTTKVIALLNDYAPKQGKRVKLIELILKEGIGQELLDTVNMDNVVQQQCIRNCIQQLTDDLYIAEDAARPAIMAIAAALNLNAAEDTDTNREEIILSAPVIIGEGETIAYKEKIIHLQSSIYCKGSLSFENCTIHCREIGANYSITLTEVGTLSMTKCVVRNYGSGESYFCIGEEGLKSPYGERALVHMSFNHCEFIDCCAFLWGPVLMENCRVVNPGPDFINGGNSKIRINASEFLLQNVPQFASSKRYIVRCFALHLSECLVHGAPGQVTDSTINYFIDVTDRSYIEHCEFRELNYTAITTYGLCDIRFSVFDQCKSSSLLDCPQGNIADCRFDRCSGRLSMGERGIVVRCQFNQCLGDVESGNTIIGSFAGVEINTCEFNNWEGKEGDCMLHFNCFGTVKSKVVRCIFRGIRAGRGFAIVGNGAKNQPGVVDVADCKFINCTTERDSGKIIRQYDSYLNLFNREKKFQTVYIHDCIGLDQINSGGGGVVDIIPKTQTANGEEIGLSR